MYPYVGPMYFDPRAAAEQARGWLPQQQEREPAPVKFTEGKLFIGGVDAHHITKEDLVEYCSGWGEVADAVVMEKKNYGFVTFADPKNAMKFLEKRVHELKGRRLDAKAAVPKAHLGTAKLTKKMFVGGTGELTDEDFREHFAQFGEIEDAAVVRREGQSRGFGFVTFADEISVEKCLLVNHYIKGRKVELKRAVPKEDLGAAAAAAGGIPLAGPHAAVFGPPGFQPQQMYGYPYAPAGPPPFGMRPAAPYAAAPPGAAAGPMMGPPVPHDPYAPWYAMGYMPYYPAAGYGGYYGPMVPPQHGLPYGSMPFMPASPGAVRPATAQLPAATGAAVVREEAPFLQVPGTRPAGLAPGHRGPGRPQGSTNSTGGAAPTPAGSSAAAAAAAGGPGSMSELAAAGTSSPSTQITGGQQQQLDPAPAGPDSTATAAAPDGTSSSPGTAEGLQRQQQQGRSSSAGQLAGSSQAQLSGHPAGSSPAGIARRGPVIMAYPTFPSMGPMAGMQPQPLPMPPRAIYTGPLMQVRAGQQQQQQMAGTLLPAGFGAAPPGQHGQGQLGAGAAAGDTPSSGSRS